jgi:predicted nucleotidyltransferase
MANLDAAIAILRCYESALRARGIRHAAVFGSVARGDNRPDSDLDILVEFEPQVEGPVDVIDRDALKPHLRAPSARDAVYAF